MKKKFTTYFGLLTILIAFLFLALGSLVRTSQAETETQEFSRNINEESISNMNAHSNDREVSSTPIFDITENTSSIPNKTEGIEYVQKTEDSHAGSVSTLNTISNIVDSITLTDSDGNVITEASQYTDIRVNIIFSLPNNLVSSGDKTTITLPSELKLESNLSFNVTNASGDIVAVAQTDISNNTVVLIYTAFVETHSDITGSLFFNSKIDNVIVEDNSTNSIYVDVEGEQIFVGDIHYENSGDNESEKFSKYSWFVNDEGTEIFNVLRVNPSGNSYSDVTIEDILKTEDFFYLQDTFTIKLGNWELDNNHIWQFNEIEDITNQVLINFMDNNFSIHLGNIGNQEYQISYRTKSGHPPVNGESFKNYAKMTDNENIIREVETTRVYQSGGGEADGYNYTVKIHKENEKKESLAGAKFEVLRTSTGKIIGIIESDINGDGEIAGLLKDNYVLKEVEAPEGYVISSETVDISPEDFGADKTVRKTVVNKKQEDSKTSINGSKVWNDMNNRYGERPNKIIVNLLANGEKIDEKQVDSSNAWSYEFTNLPKEKDGKNIVYTVSEEPVDNYITEIKGTTITNTYSPVSIKGTKIWNDNNDSHRKRPNKITVNLLANGEHVESKIVTDSTDWAYEFIDLPKKSDGKDIVYTVTENAVENYTTEIDGFTIINTYSPGNISGTVSKHWDDSNDKDGLRPDHIEIQLYANDEQKGQPIELNEKNKWTYTWKKLEAFDVNKNTIQYSIKEVNVSKKYKAKVTDENTGNLLITNKLISDNSIGVTSDKQSDNNSKFLNSEKTFAENGFFQYKKLPSTGEQSRHWTIVAGVLISLSAIVYFFKKR